MSNESISLNGVVDSVSLTDILTLIREILVLCMILPVGIDPCLHRQLERNAGCLVTENA